MLSENQLAMIAAVDRGDWDQALQLGLLDAVIDDTWPNANALRTVQAERRFALQSRDRYLAKLAREDERKQALQRKRAKTTALPSAAQSALARAKERAALKRK